MAATTWTITSPQTPAAPVPQPASNGGAVNVKWFVGWAGAWILLAGLAEMPDSGKLAAGLAVSIAIGVTYKILPGLTVNLKGVF